VFFGLVLFSGQVGATWYWTHGNSAHVEDEAAVSWARKGDGLEVNPTFQPSTWVHFAVPTIGEASTGVRYVGIEFNVTHAVDSRVSQVRVYNGNILVKTFTLDFNTYGSLIFRAVYENRHRVSCRCRQGS
jgi:hypothetical protein